MSNDPGQFRHIDNQEEGSVLDLDALFDFADHPADLPHGIDPVTQSHETHAGVFAGDIAGDSGLGLYDHGFAHTADMGPHSYPQMMFGTSTAHSGKEEQHLWSNAGGLPQYQNLGGADTGQARPPLHHHSSAPLPCHNHLHFDEPHSLQPHPSYQLARGGPPQVPIGTSSMAFGGPASPSFRHPRRNGGFHDHPELHGAQSHQRKDLDPLAYPQYDTTSSSRAVSETPASQRWKKAPAKQAPALPWPKDQENPVCPMCPNQKRFKPTVENKGEYCNKHRKKMKKEEESQNPPVYQVDHSVDAGSWDNTQGKVYPTHAPLCYEGDGEDDFLAHTGAEDVWVKQFIEAANMVYEEDDDTPEPRSAEDQRMYDNALKQQKAYNHKPHEGSSKAFYTNDWINARMRLLFRAVLYYHQGGPSIYPIGGNNNGYGEDKNLQMSERLSRIVGIMESDKRVVMDVIEGRGVAALAANPNRFADRKDSNNKCNAKKKRRLEKVGGLVADEKGDDSEDGKEVQYATLTPAATKRKRKTGLA